MAARTPRRLTQRLRSMRDALSHRLAELEARDAREVSDPSVLGGPADDSAVVEPPHPVPPLAAADEARATAAPAEPPHPVPFAVRAAAAWSWRVLVIVAAVALFGWLAWEFKVVIFPVFLAMLIAAGLATPVRRLRAAGWDRGPSAVTVFVVFVLVVAGALTLVGNAMGDQFGQVVDQAEEGLQEIRDWLAGPPFRVDEAQLSSWIERVASLVQDNESAVTEGAAAAATVAFEIFLGIVLTLFTLVFFLYDGDRIWSWLVGLLPGTVRTHVRGAGSVAWRTLSQYVRGTLLIALFDAITVTVLLLILRVPLALPLGVLVFFGAFVPLVGAFVTGALAVLVALVTQGLIAAIIVLIGLVAIQQLEGHVFQPFVLGRMVRIHPLAVVIAVSLGSIAGGVIGAIIAVPIVAVANTAGKYLASAATPATPPPPVPPPPLSPNSAGGGALPD